MVLVLVLVVVAVALLVAVWVACGGGSTRAAAQRDAIRAVRRADQAKLRGPTRGHR